MKSGMKSTDIENESLQCIHKLYYLEDVNGAGGGAEGSSVASLKWLEVKGYNPPPNSERTFPAHAR